MGIGKRIKKMREKENIIQKELANKVRVSSQVISNWERGYTSPDYDDVLRLSEALNCSGDYLLGRSNDPRLSKKEDEEANERARELLEILESMEDEEERKSLEEQVLSYAKFLREADKNKK